MNTYDNNNRYDREDDLFNGTELRARGNWDVMKGKAKQAYGDLTDDDLTYEEGRQDEWLGRLSTKLGRTVDDVKDWFRSL